MKTLLGKLWRRFPPRVRRWGVRLATKRFGVTIGAVIEDGEGRILLLKHRFRPGSGWGVPGGFINKGEQPEDALRRELREEVGLELRNAHIAFVRTHRRPSNVEIIYRCVSGERASEIVPRSIEIISLGWFARDAMPAELSPDQHRIIRRALDI